MQKTLISCQKTKYRWTLIYWDYQSPQETCDIIPADSNLVWFKSCAFLPKAQAEVTSSWLHISYFLQKCKKGKPSKKNLPYLKTISQPIETLPKLKIHSRYLQAALIKKSRAIADPALQSILPLACVIFKVASPLKYTLKFHSGGKSL